MIHIASCISYGYIYKPVYNSVLEASSSCVFVKRSGNALAHALAKLPLSISNGVNGDVLLPAVMLNLDLILKVCTFPQKKLGN